MSVSLFGTKWNSPIVLSPVSAQKAFHPEGEVAVARAARAQGHLMMLSTVATSSIEDVTAAAGTPVWQQLYPTNVWEVSRAIVKRAETAGSPAIVLTVDLQEGGNRRGTDIFKALARGAAAVGIGRPHSWGLAAFGQRGVEAVLEILRRELRTIMRQAGTVSVDKITRNYIAGRSS